MSSSAGAASSGGYGPVETDLQLATRLDWPRSFPVAVTSDPVGGAPETEDQFDSKAALPVFFKYMKYQIARLPADMTEQRRSRKNFRPRLQRPDTAFHTEYKTHNDLPLARIKRVMKANEDVRMISAEAPVLLAKAVEMFVVDLSMR